MKKTATLRLCSLFVLVVFLFPGLAEAALGARYEKKVGSAAAPAPVVTAPKKAPAPVPPAPKQQKPAPAPVKTSATPRQDAPAAAQWGQPVVRKLPARMTDMLLKENERFCITLYEASTAVSLYYKEWYDRAKNRRPLPTEEGDKAMRAVVSRYVDPFISSVARYSRNIDYALLAMERMDDEERSQFLAAIRSILRPDAAEAANPNAEGLREYQRRLDMCATPYGSREEAKWDVGIKSFCSKVAKGIAKTGDKIVDTVSDVGAWAIGKTADLGVAVSVGTLGWVKNMTEQEKNVMKASLYGTTASVLEGARKTAVFFKHGAAVTGVAVGAMAATTATGGLGLGVAGDLLSVGVGYGGVLATGAATYKMSVDISDDLDEAPVGERERDKEYAKGLYKTAQITNLVYSALTLGLSPDSDPSGKMQQVMEFATNTFSTYETAKDLDDVLNPEKAEKKNNYGGLNEHADQFYEDLPRLSEKLTSELKRQMSSSDTPIRTPKEILREILEAERSARDQFRDDNSGGGGGSGGGGCGG